MKSPANENRVQFWQSARCYLKTCAHRTFYKSVLIFSQPHNQGQNVTLDQFLNRLKLVRIQNFPSPRLAKCTIAIYMNMRNVRGMFIRIYIEHRNLEIRKTRNDFSVQVQNFLLPLSLNGFWHKERGTNFLFWLFHLPPSRATPAQGLREQAKVNPPCPVCSLNSLTFFFKISQNPPHASGAWCHSHSVTPFPISGYCDISEWHVRSARTRVNTCVNVAPK